MRRPVLDAFRVSGANKKLIEPGLNIAMQSLERACYRSHAPEAVKVLSKSV